jgi:hypothetical protein
VSLVAGRDAWRDLIGAWHRPEQAVSAGRPTRFDVEVDEVNDRARCGHSQALAHEQAALVEVLGDHARTIRPTVSQPILSRPQIGVRAICWASHATTSSKSRVCAAPGRAHGTAPSGCRSRGSADVAARTRSRSG